MAIKRSDAAGEAEETRLLAQEVGRRSVSQLEASLARITVEAASTGRGLLKALVWLNGGGIALTVLSAPGMNAPSIVPAMIFFIFGVALALIALFVSALSALFMARPIGEASGHWAQVSVTGDISDAAMKAAGNVRKKGLIWSGAPLATALASLLLFMTGAMTLADGVAPPAAPEVSAAEAALANQVQAQSNAASAVVAPAPSTAVTPAATPTPAPTSTPAQQPTARPQAARPAPARPQQRPAANPPAQTPTPAPVQTPQLPAANP